MAENETDALFEWNTKQRQGTLTVGTALYPLSNYGDEDKAWQAAIRKLKLLRSDQGSKVPAWPRIKRD